MSDTIHNLRAQNLLDWIQKFNAGVFTKDHSIDRLKGAGWITWKCSEVSLAFFTKEIAKKLNDIYESKLFDPHDVYPLFLQLGHEGTQILLMSTSTFQPEFIIHLGSGQTRGSVLKFKPAFFIEGPWSELKEWFLS